MKYLVIAIVSAIIVMVLQGFTGKKNAMSVENSDLLEAGQLLFPNFRVDFEQFFNSFLSDKEKFLSENEELLSEYDNFDLEKLKALEVIYIFGDSKQQLWLIDWKGEENTREIEKFMENELQITNDWTNANKLRGSVAEKKQRDGEFIVDLLKSIDKDLEQIGKKMIFINFDWDSYVCTVVDRASYNIIIEKFGTSFHGAQSLKR